MLRVCEVRPDVSEILKAEKKCACDWVSVETDRLQQKMIFPKKKKDTLTDWSHSTRSPCARFCGTCCVAQDVTMMTAMTTFPHRDCEHDVSSALTFPTAHLLVFRVFFVPTVLPANFLIGVHDHVLVSAATIFFESS